MNMDFHYYATYLAARVAGYEKEEAKTIAYAAQYVDESDADMIDKELLPGLAEPTPTIESMGTLLKRSLDWINLKTQDWGRESAQIKESEPVWRSFHFLPGNIHEEDDRKAYMGERKYTRTFLGMHLLGNPEYGEEEARAFSLMCQPNSILSEKMVNDTRKHRDQPYFLELLGIRMHVLADTWAHRYFAGTPSWWVNEAPKEVYDVSGRKEMEYSLLKDFSIKNFNQYMADNYYMATPPMLSFKSFSYLGHGRMGGVPDVPFMHYRYVPKWSNEAVEKDNREEFLLAFRQLVYAMNCIREQFYYERNVYSDISGEMEAELKAVFRNKEYKASKAAALWKPLIDKFYPGESAFLPDFDKEKWKKEAAGAGDKKNTHYYHFNYSALKHRRYVTDYVEELWNVPAVTKTGKMQMNETDVIMLIKAEDNDRWQWISGGIQYLGHDRSRWMAQYQNGRFYLYYKGDRKRCHTSDCLDYLGKDNKRYRAAVEPVEKDGEKGWKLKIREVIPGKEENAGESREKWQEVKEMTYLSWDRKVYEMAPTIWGNMADKYLKEDSKEMSRQIFVCERKGLTTVSLRVRYLYAKDDGSTENRVFESVFRKDLKPQYVLNVNTEQSKEQNVMTPSLQFSTDGKNNHVLEMHHKEFIIDGKEEWDVFTIRDWDGEDVNLYIIQWVDV